MNFFPRVVSIFMLATAMMFMVVGDADARRFGGGRSFGKSYSSAKPATPSKSSSSSANRSNANSSGQRSGASRWLGPLAGLAAGGLLASMFMGDGFEGIQFMDILLIGGLIFGVIFLLKKMRGGGLQRQQYAAGAAGAAGGQGGSHSSGFQIPGIGSNLGGGGGGADSEDNGLSQQAPDWFDPDGFLKGARQQFMTMQKAWDERDMDAIRETVTPEMYQQLAAERDSLPSDNHTEVVTLNSDILGYTYEPSRVVVSVAMSGLIKEQVGAQPQAFDEVWHVQRSTSDPSANWYVAGIQQND